MRGHLGSHATQSRAGTVWIWTTRDLLDAITMKKPRLRITEAGRRELADRRVEVEAACRWIVGGDTGISSETIWAAMMGVQPARWGTPRDPADFGRCLRLLQAIPAWRGRLFDVAVRYADWRPFVARWDDLEKLWNEEVPDGRGSAPRLYVALKDCEAQMASNWGNEEGSS